MPCTIVETGFPAWPVGRGPFRGEILDPGDFFPTLREMSGASVMRERCSPGTVPGEEDPA